MASLVNRDDLASAIAYGMEGAEHPESYDVLEELTGWIASFDTEMVQVSQTEGFVVIARAEAPPEDA